MTFVTHCTFEIKNLVTFHGSYSMCTDDTTFDLHTVHFYTSFHKCPTRARDLAKGLVNITSVEFNGR